METKAATFHVMALAASLLFTGGAAHAQIGTPSDPNAYVRPGTGNVLTDHLAGLPTNFPGDKLDETFNEHGGLLRRAYDAYSAGRYSEAATRLGAIVFKSPNTLLAHRMLADIYIRQDKIKDAIPEMEEVVRLDPKDDNTRDNLGIAYIQTGQYDKASAFYRDALTQNPKNAKLAFSYAAALDRGGRHAEAAQAFDRAAVLDPKNPRPALYAGLLYHLSGTDTQARPLLQKALTLGTSERFKAYTALAEAAVAAKDNAGAFQNYTLAAQADPKNALTRYNIGVLYEQQGKTDLALEAYKQAAALDPHLTDAGEGLARLGK